MGIGKGKRSDNYTKMIKSLIYKPFIRLSDLTILSDGVGAETKRPRKCATPRPSHFACKFLWYCQFSTKEKPRSLRSGPYGDLNHFKSLAPL